MDLRAMLQFPAFQNAFMAGTLVAIVAGCVGYFLLLRGLTFAGHALSHVGFAGAAGALVIGVDPIFGLLAFTLLAGIGIGALGKRLDERDITIGIIMTLLLAAGSLFISLYRGYAEQAYSILFGTVMGISHMDVLVTAGLCLLVLAGLAAVFRMLLFCSYDPQIAEARGVPVKFLSMLFMIFVAITVSLSVQVVGVLLIFTLLVGPAAAAMQWSASPLRAVAISVALALGYTWLGIYLAIRQDYPVTFCIATIAFIGYLLVKLVKAPIIQRVFTGGQGIRQAAAVSQGGGA
ncbi:MAG TPA: metal ABC transporter permease [Tepidisphaeraceae bacterium]|nr:metal ABC transporter permease [Tepidisphaeraceae bacterium]